MGTLETVAAGLSILLATPAFGATSGPVTIRATAGQMLSLADEMARHGKTDEAENIFEILARDPDSDIRNEARYRRARLLRARSNYRDAALLLRRILDERPDATPARLELAQLLDRMGDKDGAWRQVRAAQAAGLPTAVARLIDRYSDALRAQRPFGASFEIAIAPDSNINRATRSDSLGTVLGDFQIANDAKAKSGTGLSLSAQAFRRVAIGEDANLLLRASGLANIYRRGRFNDVAADLAGGPEFSFGRDRLQLEIGGTRRWFGPRPYLRSVRLGGTFSHPLGSRTLLRITGAAALIDNRLNDLQDGRSYFGRFELERALTPTTGVAGSLAVDRQALKDPGYATTGWRGGLTGWHDQGRMTFSAAAEFGRLRADERLVLLPDRRQDRYMRVSLGASFRQLQYAGFAPLVRFSIERNRSTTAFYDYRRTRTELAVVRAF